MQEKQIKSGGGPRRKSRPSSVETALRLLKAFSEKEEEIGVSALALKLGVAKSTVHRLAVTMVSEGVLEQNPDTERYRLGLALFGLGTLVRRRMDFASEARPFLFELREKTGETLLLGVPVDLDVMSIFSLESNQALRTRSDIGVQRPAHCTAVGRAIFAFSPPEMVERLLAGPLVRRTPNTITSQARLREILSEVREKGYAIEDAESEPGIRCVAAPVRGPLGTVVGAVGIAGPSQRLSLDSLDMLAVPLAETVSAISHRLGYRTG